MHAKMTRDRKKCFVASLNCVIAKLEEENQEMRDLLERSRDADQSVVEPAEERKPEAIVKNDPVPTSLSESSAALMSIPNSRIFTIG
jgi:hypothetical protein